MVSIVKALLKKCSIKTIFVNPNLVMMWCMKSFLKRNFSILKQIQKSFDVVFISVLCLWGKTVENKHDSTLIHCFSKRSDTFKMHICFPSLTLVSAIGGKTSFLVVDECCKYIINPDLQTHHSCVI